MMGTVLRIACLACVALTTTTAAAAPATVALFAPSAPFPSTAARVELANRLGRALGTALRGARGGRVYARAADFAAAVRSGEVTVAVVDPAYLANAGGNYTVVASAVYRGTSTGTSDRAWQVVARTGTKLTELAGKRVVVPSLGGREIELVTHALFGGEIGRTFFAAIEPAPDTASALAALGLGKADAAVVPVTGELPPGTSAVLALPALPTAVLVVYGALTPRDRDVVLSAASGFIGDATIQGFRAAEPDLVAGVARRFRPPAKRGPFVVPVLRLVAGELAVGRGFTIEPTPATAFAIVPPAR
jgi:hypothetical protein